MSSGLLAERIAPDQRLLLDTSVLVAYLNGEEAVSPFATQLLTDFVATERNEAVVSTASVAELMVRPIRTGPAAESTARTFLLEYPGIYLRSVDVLVAGEAAAIRADTNLRLTDCLVAATAVLTSCDIVVTNDQLLAQRFTGLRPGIDVLLLADLIT